MRISEYNAPIAENIERIINEKGLTIAIQSYSVSLYGAASLNERVKEAMEKIIEAEGTISGSFNMMKASATNFLASLTGVKDGNGNAILSVEDSLNDLVNSAVSFASNVIPAIGSVMTSLPKAIVQAMQTYGPQAIVAAQEMLANLLTYIPSIPYRLCCHQMSIHSWIRTVFLMLGSATDSLRFLLLRKYTVYQVCFLQMQLILLLSYSFCSSFLHQCNSTFSYMRFYSTFPSRVPIHLYSPNKR